MDRSGVPRQVLLAGVGVGAEAVAALVATVMLLVGPGSGDLPIAAVLAEAALFLLGTAALAFVAWGLETGRRWARTPAIVVQLLLLPVVYSMIGPSRQLVLGVVAGLVVAGTFLLLLSDAARMWSMDLPQDQA